MASGDAGAAPEGLVPAAAVMMVPVEQMVPAVAVEQKPKRDGQGKDQKKGKGKGKGKGKTPFKQFDGPRGGGGSDGPLVAGRGEGEEGGSAMATAASESVGGGKGGGGRRWAAAVAVAAAASSSAAAAAAAAASFVDLQRGLFQSQPTAQKRIGIIGWALTSLADGSLCRDSPWTRPRQIVWSLPDNVCFR